MTGTSWIIDSQRIASKIKNVSGSRDLSKQKWMSNPTKECPKCSHIIDNSDVVHQWPGLPKGVKFDPSDQELLWHLLAKHDKAGSEPHPFIDEFIPTVEEDDGICYTHPQKLPGVKQDGSVSHFFHRTFKAYNTGTRKRRKINTGDLADVRWHKTGKTKPVILNGEHLGCKKIMVLYMSTVKGGKPKKTNWVMHQYHLGTGEDEKNGEYVVSKLFFQQQFKPGEKSALELTNTDALETIVSEAELPDLLEPTMEEEDERISGISFLNNEYNAEEEALHSHEHNTYQENGSCEINMEEKAAEENAVYPSSEKPEDGDNPPSQDPNLWEGDSQFSQFLLDSQQLAENLACCDEFLQSQPSSGDGDEPGLIKPRLAVYAQLPVEDLKKDLQECKDLGSSDDATLEPGNKDLQECKDLGSSDDATLEPENTAEFRLSQIQFSQDSYTAWAGDKVIN